MNKLVLRVGCLRYTLRSGASWRAVFIGADSGGAGVQLGPVGVGVGPRFSDDRYYRRGYDANAYYGSDCRLNPFASRYAQRRVVFRRGRSADNTTLMQRKMASHKRGHRHFGESLRPLLLRKQAPKDCANA
jgi:hypothetical protein